ncbi:MAG: CPBP family glutamic-type intramembrane protease [Pseudomonadota bacterium]
MTKNTFLPNAALLWLGGLFGAVAVIPYSLAINPGGMAQAAEQTGLTQNTLLILSLVQSAVLLAIMSFAGLWAARKLGLGTPMIESLLRRQGLPARIGRHLRNAVFLGIACSMSIILLDAGLFAATLDSAVGESIRIEPWKGFLASFYGGISEEIQLRLFFLSFMALALRWVARRFGVEGELPAGVFWSANILAALAFGLGHLPATAAIMEITPMVVIRAVLLNGILALVTGQLFRRHGLEVAIVCHFSADIVLHVLFPLIR